MSSEYKKKLSQRAKSFVGTLEKCGISSEIIENSFRLYSVKIAISKTKDCGKINLYYSPNKKTYKITSQELKDKTIFPLLEECWYQISGSQLNIKNYNIYVDGSFINGRCGYGVVILKDNKIINKISGKVQGELVKNHRQVAGELAAVKNALKWCVKNSVKEIYLYYDYAGIEKWITGTWQAKKKLTRSYVDFVKNEISNKVKIHFKKIKSHSGDRYNELADRLAKNAAKSS